MKFALDFLKWNIILNETADSILFLKTLLRICTLVLLVIYIKFFVICAQELRYKKEIMCCIQ